MSRDNITPSSSIEPTIKTATYSRYCPNVFLAKCEEECERDEIIEVVTKYGSVNECVVHNLVRKDDTHYYYSITRLDGYNVQERARRKAEQYENWAQARQKKSNQFYEASNEGADFLSLAEPIKVGHHSEKRHRALIERNYSRMAKSVENADKADQHEQKAKAWEKRSETIDLSMPESLQYFSMKLEKASYEHHLLKTKPELREHAYSLTYAGKKVKELKQKVETAKKLWGDSTPIHD